MDTFKILAVGDVVGVPGMAHLEKNLWNLREKYRADCVVVNGENSASGNGIDVRSAKTIMSSGADMITTGNHVWQKKEIYQYLETEKTILRPLNYPDIDPGRGYEIKVISGYRILFLNVMGCVFFDFGLESPFSVTERVLRREEGRYDFLVADIHAEATSEKIAFAKFLDKNCRAAVVFGTHTHVQTADEQILAGGTGYITDLGMTAAADSVLGLKNDCVLQKFTTKMPVRFEVEEEGVIFNGALFEIDRTTFRCTAVRRIRE